MGALFVVKVQISFEGFQSGEFTERFSMATRAETHEEREKKEQFILYLLFC